MTTRVCDVVPEKRAGLRVAAMFSERGLGITRGDVGTIVRVGGKSNVWGTVSVTFDKDVIKHASSRYYKDVWQERERGHGFGFWRISTYDLVVAGPACIFGGEHERA